LTIVNEPFDELLEWLDPDREAAGRKYEEIRLGLIRIFTSNGISDAGYYADETFERVMKRLPEIRATYVGNPARYFYGVARKLILEARRKTEITTNLIPDRGFVETSPSDLIECLRECLKDLSQDKRELILDYHLYHGRAKVEHHRTMAGELLISEGALRTRAHHLRVGLENCVLQCVENRTQKQNSLPAS
jgi:DNA-directed RNA polymerase specialized sigma24 family protein